LQAVGHELIEAADGPQHLLGRALADLPYRADLLSVLVQDGVFVLELEHFGLLAHHQDRFGEECPATLWRPVGDTGPIECVIEALTGDVGGWDLARTMDRVDALASLIGDLLGPLVSIEPTKLMASHRIGVPIRRCGSGFAHGAAEYGIDTTTKTGHGKS